MNFLQEKQTRSYIIFLLIMSLFLLVFILLWHKTDKEETNQILLAHEEAVTSALLQEGVSKEKIAKSYQKQIISEEGRELVHQLGITKERVQNYTGTSERILTRSLLYGIVGCSLFVVILGAGTFLYFRKREKLYIEATRAMEHFEEGDFSYHLPRNEEGTLYSLFRSADKLAMTLRSKEEEEHQGREFMKETISDISHQLKTPLAALHMYNEIVTEEPKNEETVICFTEKSALALNRMDQLIQSLLKVTKLDAGSISFSKNRVSVQELIQQAINDLETRAELENKEIHIQGKEDQMMLCDEMWTAEAVGNLVKNALDHTKQGGRITISYEQSAAMLRIMISDNGSGIPDEDLHHIFKRFYRGTGAGDQPGVGLGLPLAKAIIEGQGGLLSVQSKENEGSTFTISFLTEL